MMFQEKAKIVNKVSKNKVLRFTMKPMLIDEILFEEIHMKK